MLTLPRNASFVVIIMTSSSNTMSPIPVSVPMTTMLPIGAPASRPSSVTYVSLSALAWIVWRIEAKAVQLVIIPPPSLLFPFLSFLLTFQLFKRELSFT